MAAIVDTNSDPSTVDYAIPGNDDAVKSIRIILEAIAEAVESGREKRASRMNQGKGEAAAAAAEMVAAAEEPVAAPVAASGGTRS